MTTTMYRGGRVYAADQPRAGALLVDGDRVAWVGDDGAAAGMAADRTVHLDGALVTAAFVDAHLHATAAGLQLTGLDLTGVTGGPALLGALAAHARTAGAGGVVVGTGWDETRWADPTLPSAGQIDRAAGGARVYLARADVHGALVSSALAAAVPAAAGLAGFATDGLVTDAAHSALRAAAYGSVEPAQRRDAQRAALRRAAERGIGTVTEMAGSAISSRDDLDALLALAAEDATLPEVIAYWGDLGDVRTPTALGLPGGGGDLFVDGTLGSHSAALHADYADAPGHRGTLRHDVDQVATHVLACLRAGLQPGFHVIGDAAVDTVLHALDRVAGTVGPAALAAARPRLEHAEMAGPEAVAAMARLGVVASVQPMFDELWGGPHGMYATRLGAGRAAGMNPLAAFAAAGVPLAFGSDAPVTPIDPWGAVRAAVHHRTPGSGISARAAFAAHTRGGLRAARRDGGLLAPGAAATFAVWQVADLRVQPPDDRVARWSTDPRAAVPGLPDLSGPDPTCLRTVVRGVTIHDREGALA